MAEYKGKVKNIQDTPFGYTLSVIGGKWKMENGKWLLFTTYQKTNQFALMI